MSAPSPTDFDRALASLDTRLFDRIESQTSTNDRRSLLACQLAARTQRAPYVYLEIGSHIGGSLQPHVLDPQCQRMYSIDKRPFTQPDERGLPYAYSNNSTGRMLGALGAMSPDGITRLTCIDADASQVDPRAIDSRPHLCFIDGEHTDAAVVSDFAFCRRVLARDGAIVFHDAAVIYHGLGEIVQTLERESVTFRAYHLPDTIFVIEFDGCRFHETPAIAAMLLNNHVGYLASLRANDRFRQFANKPVFRWLRRLRFAMTRRG